jgi:alcohol dehydrogenase
LDTSRASAEDLAGWFEALAREAGFPVSLSEAGIEEGDRPELAKLAGDEWTGTFNPRPLEVKDFEALYCSAF